MSDDEQTAYVTRRSKGVYHTNPDCKRIKGYVNDTWTVAEAEDWGKRQCKHCDGFGQPDPDQELMQDLIDADPDEVAPTEFDRERASVSLAWFVAVWLAIMAASTFTGVMLYFAGVLL